MAEIIMDLSFERKEMYLNSLVQILQRIICTGIVQIAITI